MWVRGYRRDWLGSGLVRWRSQALFGTPREAVTAARARAAAGRP